MALTSDDWDRFRSGATSNIIALSSNVSEEAIEGIEPDRELLQGMARAYRRVMVLFGYPELVSVPDIEFKTTSWWCLSMLERGSEFYSVWIEAFCGKAKGIAGWTESWTSALLENLGGTFGALLVKSSEHTLSAADLRIPIGTQRSIPYMPSRFHEFAESFQLDLETTFAWTLVRDFSFLSLFNSPIMPALLELWTIAIQARAIEIFDLIIEHGRLSDFDVFIDGLVLLTGRDGVTRSPSLSDRPDFGSVVALFDAIVDFAGLNCMDGAIYSAATVVDSLSLARESRTVSETGLLEVTGLKVGLEVAERARQFVGHVVERNGRRVLPLIFTSPDLFPTRSDLDDPDRWLRRSVK